MAQGCARLSDSSGFIQKTTGIPSTAQTYTFAGWVNFASLLDAAGEVIALHYPAAGNSNFHMIQIQDNAGGNILKLFTRQPSILSYNGSAAPAIDTWYYLAMTAASSAGDLIAYRWSASGTLIDQMTGVAGGWTTAVLELGNYAFYGEWADTKFAQWRNWSTALTPSELAIERASPTPVRTSNLVCAFEDDPSTDVSGNGSPWNSVGGAGLSIISTDFPPNYDVPPETVTTNEYQKYKHLLVR